MGRIVGTLILAGLVLSQTPGDTRGETDPFAPSPGEWLVQLRTDADRDAFFARFDAALLGECRSVLRLFIPGDPAEIRAALAVDADVLANDPNYRMHTPEAVRQMVLGAIGGTREEFAEQEIAAHLGLDEAHLLSEGDGVVIAVLDTGIDPAHELFATNVSPGPDLVDGDAEPWEAAGGLDEDGDGIVDEGFGHGTMVSGLIRLVAPRATLLPIRILDDEGRTDAFRVVEAIEWAAAQDVDVINMSFGAPHTIAPIRRAIAQLAESRIVLVAGAGNEDRPGPVYHPGDLPEVLLVTAVDHQDLKGEFADFHSKVALSAPGVAVRSAYPGGEWAIGSGCSFATALVSGSAALAADLYPESEAEQLRRIVSLGTVPIDHLPGNDGFVRRLGSGRLFVPAVCRGTAGVSGTLPPTGSSIAVRPNPALDSVVFELGAPATGSEALRLIIVDAAGRRRHEILAAGPRVSWDLRDAAGESVPEGIYFVRLEDRGRTVAAGRLARVR